MKNEKMHIDFQARRGAPIIELSIDDARILWLASLGTDDEAGHTLRAFGARATAEDWARSPWSDGRGAGRVWRVTRALRATLIDAGDFYALRGWRAEGEDY